ncbi:hypothetical protein M0812_18282 [Anaeramoeba flamelloides]|uniref:Uncharacterized protein n=1 Tax=Anaeramoeba flamelloides TaxID=1746091 RepID=A0AAV7Z832_9EUKA|nr:hypothetical protein M0812_18282 [Anaeramoeba flamelloides]
MTQRKQKKNNEKNENQNDLTYEKMLKAHFQKCSKEKEKNKSLNLSERRLVNLPIRAALKSKGVIDWWRMVSDLDLSGNKLDSHSIPTEFQELKSLRSLELHHNNFHEIPRVVLSLDQLRFLGFSNNQLSVIPNDLQKMSQLYGLSLANNKLGSMAPLCRVRTLRWLSLDSNLITQIPRLIKNMKLLECLYLRHNKIRSIPQELNKCKELHELCLSYNQITEIKNGVFVFNSLKILDLSGNPIQSLPQEIQNLNLDFLAIEDCLLTSKPNNLSSLTIIDDQNPYLSLLDLTQCEIDFDPQKVEWKEF